MRDELASLVSAFRSHLQWRRDHGWEGVPADESPRSGPPSPPAQDATAPAGPGDQPREAPEAGDPETVPRSLEQIRADLGLCKRCRLHEGRRNIVFGEGSSSADLMFIGEAPGRDEDTQGIPFVGAAGQLLTRMINAMGLEREEVYIANILKCRPPQNRDPNPDEIDACEPFLRQQIDVIAPRMIIALGGFATKTLLRTDTGITQLRGRFHTYHGTPLMPTFHPAFLLRNPERKRPVWEDLKQVMAEMDRLGLKRRRGKR
jgi:DNA polymerase